jgi:type I site-specific restriction endonuclease
MPSNNQNAEQIARDRIDAKLSEAGWLALTQNQICPP